MKPVRLFSTRAYLAAASLAAFAVAPASAALLVHDGFSVGDYTLGTSPDGVNGGTGFGSTWSFQSTGTGASVEVVAGLSLAGYESSGNAVRIAANDNGGPVTGTLSRQFGQTISPNGNLWSSFLFQQNSASLPNGFDGTFAISGTKFQPGGDREFFVNPIAGRAFQSSAEIEIGTFRNPQQRETYSIPQNQTFLVIAGFENINFGAFTGNETTLNLWILDAVDIAAIGDSISVSALNANSRAKINVAPFTSTFGVGGVGETTPFDLFVQQGTATFDELRIGTTLDSVFASTIPEPASASVLLGLVALAGVALRRRQRS